MVQAWVIIFAVTLIWGSSFLLLKKALIVFSPDQVVAGRMSIAGLVFLPYAIRHFRRVPGRLWGRLFLFALIANIGTSLSYALAQSGMDSSLNGILNTLSPLMTLLVGIIFFRQKARWLQTIGIGIGLLGAAVLIFLQQDGKIGMINLFAIFSVLATFGNGWMNNLLKFQLSELKPLEVAAFTFLITLIPALVYWFASGAMPLVTSHESGLQALIFIAMLAILSNGLALLLIARLVQLSSPVFASLTTYLIPIVALAWGVWDGEHIWLAEILAMFLISFSVYLVNRDSR
ncbi:MAG: DMT family transporter [Bacteroidia bacterium]|nr:DMT family transporter [Bacteroidia bacterium]